MNYKEQYVEAYRKYIRRDGAASLLNWLMTTDFFEAPASTKYHGNFPGGLALHSLNVFERMRNNCVYEFGAECGGAEPFPEEDLEPIAIVALLHDICKANFYTVEMRNRKNEQGQWEKYPYYVVDDQLPYGHGEKSVYIISGFMKLTREEAMAIRWHMGFSDTDFKGGGFSVGNAFGKFPLAVLTHIADLQATYLDEAEGE